MNEKVRRENEDGKDARVFQADAEATGVHDGAEAWEDRCRKWNRHAEAGALGRERSAISLSWRLDVHVWSLGIVQ